MNGNAWYNLARLYRDDRDLTRAEICYVAALYCDIGNIDLAKEWCGVYASQRFQKYEGETMQEIAESVVKIEEGMKEVLKSPLRTIEELVRCGDLLDDPRFAVAGML